MNKKNRADVIRWITLTRSNRFKNETTDVKVTSRKESMERLKYFD